MITYLTKFFPNLSTILLLGIIVFMLWTLGKGADMLVDEAVSLSIRWGVPKMIIGATIVSLGTTLPEATVSFLAAIQGQPDMALGNAIGSIIANTSLIIGLAAITGNLLVDRKTIDRQGRFMSILGILLVIVSIPFFSSSSTGYITQATGIMFLILLVIYLFLSRKWSKDSEVNKGVSFGEDPLSLFSQLVKLILGFILLIVSSRILIPAVEITAFRVGIPQVIIAATLVAFGTSLPELVTAITSVRKGHGELAVGNIIGANILNILFVVGGAASISRGGLSVSNNFYQLQMPTMIVVLALFHFFSRNKKNIIGKKEGVVLLVSYCGYLMLNISFIK